MTYKSYTGLITKLEENQIFVFGSNPEGRHGAGTAKIAKNKYGAIYGQGHGLQGQSYGLVTKNLKKGFVDPFDGKKYTERGPRSVSERRIIENIKRLYGTAREMPDKEFLVAYTGDGRNLNGYSSMEMAAMFHKAGRIPTNIVFEEKFYGMVHFV